MPFLTRFSRLVLVPALLGLSACNFLDVGPPPTEVVDTNVFRADASASAAILGIYIGFTNAGTNTPGIANDATLSTFLGLAADELLYASPDFDEYRLNQINPSGNGPSLVWSQAYTSIYQCNTAITGLMASTTLTASLKTQLLGEARFLRAFNYFYLTNLFGDVPLVLTADYTVSGKLPRAPRADVYAAVVADLLEAQKLLISSYPGSGERTRANQAAATALLARVYLYQQNWATAEAQATAVLTQPGQYSLSDLGQVFLANSDEAIWQLRRSGTISTNTYEGLYFVPASRTTAPTNTYQLTSTLYSAFDTLDDRRTTWTSAYTVAGTTYRYPSKYKQRIATPNAGAATEYSMVLRLAEQYLIRAEARIRQGNVAAGVADLNTVRSRAGVPALSTALSSANALLAVEEERRLELFSEYGHRWFDLIRTGRVAAVLGPYKGTAWDTDDNLWPVPGGQLLANPALTQNAGY